MLAAWVKDFEVVVVNDGSTDRTGAIVSAIMEAEPRVRLVTHARNQGYGSTLADGFAAATKELTFFMDSDGQFDIRDLARLLPFIDEFDAVIGYRLDRQDTWVRKLNAWGWNALIRNVLGIHARDIDCAFKLLRTDFLHQHPLETRGAMINTELLYQLKRAGYSYREVGVHHLPRRGGEQREPIHASSRAPFANFSSLFASGGARKERMLSTYSFPNIIHFRKDLFAARLVPRIRHNVRVLAPVLCLGLLALMLTSAVWSTIPVLANETSMLPVAGPSGQPAGGLGGSSNADTALIRYLQAHRGSAKYLIAMVSSNAADSIILETNQPVMALGGFSGSDPILTTTQLAALVKSGAVRFFLLNGSGGAGPGGSGQSALITWIK